MLLAICLSIFSSPKIKFSEKSGNFDTAALTQLGPQRGFDAAPCKQYSTDFGGSRLFETSIKQIEYLSIEIIDFPNLSDSYL